MKVLVACSCFYIVSFVIGVSINNNAHAQIKQQQPNILWITCEDMSANLPMYGDSTIETPHLSKLAKQAVQYNYLYSVSGVCAPSRSAIITGMFPPSIGTHHMRTSTGSEKDPNIPGYQAVPPPGVKAFPEYLRAAGYYCTNNTKTDYQFGEPFTVWDQVSNKAHWRNRPAGKPFFAVFNIMDTHESKIWDNAKRPLRVDPTKIKIPPYYPESPVVRNDMARYYDNIIRMDSIAGHILNQLEEDGLASNTIVFFFSDHGAGLPWYKRELYTRGLHVPLLIRFPGKTGAGTKNNQLLSFMDLAPSVLSLAGISIPGHIQGKAFLGNQKSAIPNQFIYAARDRMDEHYDMVRSVLDKKYEYIRNYQPQKLNYMDLAYRKQMDMMQEILAFKDAGKLNKVQMRWFQAKPAEELYDLVKDPFQLNNLAANPAYKTILERYRKIQNDWTLKVGDLGFMNERDMVNLVWPNGKQPLTEKPVVSRGNLKGNEEMVTIHCNTPGASIGYKTGNKNSDWQLYTKPVVLTKGEKLVAKAIRYGFQESEEHTYKSQ